MNNEQLLEQTKKIMAELNQRLFNNQLNLNFEVKLSSSGKAAASVMTQGIGFPNNRIYFVKYLQVSKYFQWTEKQLVDVIAHELIHVYEVQVLKQKPNHSRNFLNKMYEINKNFPDILVTVRHKMESTKLKKQNKSIIFLLSENKDKIVFISSKNILPSDTSLRLSFGNFTLGKVCSSRIKGYRVARQIKYSYKITPLHLQKFGIL